MVAAIVIVTFSTSSESNPDHTAMQEPNDAHRKYITHIPDTSTYQRSST